MVNLLHLGLKQIDIKNAFLHFNLKEKIFMSDPEGFEAKGHEGYPFLLHKSFYGLTQSLRKWYKRFDLFILPNGHYRNMFDSYVYLVGMNSGEGEYLLLYVDDMLIIG